MRTHVRLVLRIGLLGIALVAVVVMLGGCGGGSNSAAGKLHAVLSAGCGETWHPPDIDRPSARRGWIAGPHSTPQTQWVSRMKWTTFDGHLDHPDMTGSGFQAFGYGLTGSTAKGLEPATFGVTDNACRIDPALRRSQRPVGFVMA